MNTIDHLISHRTVFVSLIYTFSPYNGVIPCDTISESSLLVAMYNVVVIGHVVYFFSTPSRFSIIAKVKPSFLIGPVYFHGVKYFRRIIYRGLLTSHTFASNIIFILSLKLTFVYIEDYYSNHIKCNRSLIFYCLCNWNETHNLSDNNNCLLIEESNFRARYEILFC